MSQPTTTSLLSAATTAAPAVRARMETPWGTAQGVKKLAPEIYWVTTASHGGLKLSAERNGEMPDCLRNDSEWYEEDAEWAKAAVRFEELFLQSSDRDIKRIILSGAHRNTLRDWFPEAYEQFYGVKLNPGESRLNDENLFFEEHGTDLIGVSAFGDWHARVPEAMVGVIARVGGQSITVKSPASGPDRYFLVPKEEYEVGNRFGFVIDRSRHEEIEILD